MICSHKILPFETHALSEVTCLASKNMSYSTGECAIFTKQFANGDKSKFIAQVDLDEKRRDSAEIYFIFILNVKVVFSEVFYRNF